MRNQLYRKEDSNGKYWPKKLPKEILIILLWVCLCEMTYEWGMRRISCIHTRTLVPDYCQTGIENRK